MKTPAPKLSFSFRFNMLLKSIIRQRQKLISLQKSCLPEYRVNAKIDFLLRYVDFGFTDKGAATFLLNHQHDIKYLIPNNRSGLARTFHLDVLIAAAQILTSKSHNHAH